MNALALISLSGLVPLLIHVIIIALICWLCWWLTDWLHEWSNVDQKDERGQYPIPRHAELDGRGIEQREAEYQKQRKSIIDSTETTL